MTKPGHKERMIAHEKADLLMQQLRRRGCRDVRQRRSRKGRTVIMWTETEESLEQPWEDVWLK